MEFWSTIGAEFLLLVSHMFYFLYLILLLVFLKYRLAVGSVKLEVLLVRARTRGTSLVQRLCSRMD
jgi:hypothetical protein